MLRTYSKSITANANNAIVFNTNKILTGNTISHNGGSSSVIVNKPGYYKVDLDISSTVGTTGEVSIQLYADGIAIPDAIITANITAGEYSNNSFSTIIRATPGTVNQNVNLTVMPTVDLTISSVALGIDRIA